jgi:hypothetical protein
MTPSSTPTVPRRAIGKLRLGLPPPRHLAIGGEVILPQSAPCHREKPQ